MDPRVPGVAKCTDEDVALARALSALSNPVRITMLRLMRSPRLMSEIAVAAESDRVNPSEDRPMSRQAVRDHLRRLLEAGVASSRPAEHDFGESFAYTVNHRSLYAIAEDLRALAALRPERDVTEDDTAFASPWRAASREGPRLVLVRGLGEGTMFGLDSFGGARSEWVIGRRRGAAVRIDYDPFVSHENAVLVRTAAGFSIEDLPGSLNGTLVNFSRITAGKPRPIAHGDIIGVGRSLLVFHEHAPDR